MLRGAGKEGRAVAGAYQKLSPRSQRRDGRLRWREAEVLDCTCMVIDDIKLIGLSKRDGRDPISRERFWLVPGELGWRLVAGGAGQQICHIERVARARVDGGQRGMRSHPEDRQGLDDVTRQLGQARAG